MAELVRVQWTRGTMSRVADDSKERYQSYLRRYYAQNRAKNPEYYNRNGDSKASYSRQYNFQRREAMQSRDEGADMRAHRRRYSSQNVDRNAEYRARSKGARLDYYRQYHLRKKEEGNNSGLKVDNGRHYSCGRKEYYRSCHGYRKFNQSWRTPETVRDYFESIATRLNISNIDDWYRISRRQMDQNGGISLYNKFGSLGAALQYAYPEVRWDSTHRGKKSGQRWLKLKIEALLPGVDIIEDYQHPDLNWGMYIDLYGSVSHLDSDRNMELDLWITRHRIGIEYQGEQHFYNVDSFGPSSGAGAYSERDTLKSKLCESRGITLIAIPYWWDGSTESLSATLYQARPDVFPVSGAHPIPSDKPAKCRLPSNVCRFRFGR